MDASNKGPLTIIYLRTIWQCFVVAVLIGFVTTATLGCAIMRNSTELHKTDPSIGEQRWKLFQGAWFSIVYPAEFSVRPSLESNTIDDNFDSAFFDKRDGTVSFYVLSPQWRRNASDTHIDPTSEVLLKSDRSVFNGTEKSAKVIAARNGSYERIVEVFTLPEQAVQWIFQFYYTDQASKKAYERSYEVFKQSLEQTTD